MQDSVISVLDNQFIRIAEPRTVKPRPIVRHDYSALLANLRERQSPPRPTAYLDGIKQSPAENPVTVVDPEPPAPTSVEVQAHQYHQPLISHELFQCILESNSSALTNQVDVKPRKLRWPRLNKLQVAMMSLAAVLLAGGIYLSIIGWQSTNLVKKQAAHLTALANNVNSSKSDGSSPALATTPISAATLANYTVAPNSPRYIIIPSLGVDARVFPVGLTSTGALGTPDNVFDAAWYKESAQPGQPGAMLIDGHVSSWTTHGVFYGLKDLKTGDVIRIVRGDGQTFNYLVVKSQIFPSNKVDMQSAIEPVVGGQPGLNLITCTGDVVAGTSTFSQRIVVYATQPK